MELPTYFEKFVSNVQPTEERISAVADGHNTLRGHLQDDAELAYPVADSFLSGSYARKTAIDPIKDADIILILELTTLSEDRREPRPRHVLENLRTAIDAFYDDVNLETQRRSIQVLLPDVDVRMDVVPAMAPDGKGEELFVPDYEQNIWVPSKPIGHIEWTRIKNAESNGQFVRVVKALKWWRGRALTKAGGPKSFLLEVMAGHHLHTSDCLPVTFVRTARAMRDALAASYDRGEMPTVPDPSLADNDLAASCGWTRPQVKAFIDALRTLIDVAQRAIDAQTKEESIRLWQSVFGDPYPSSLTDEEDRALAKSLAVGRPEPTRVLRPYAVEVSARVRPTNKSAVPLQPYASGSRKLPKNYDIHFRLERTSVPTPYHVRWTVVNHGAEARAKNDLRRVDESGGMTSIQHTGYRGHHFMVCEVIKNGIVLATNRFLVRVA